MIKNPPEQFPQPPIIEEATNEHGWKVRQGGPLAAAKRSRNSDIIGKLN